MKNGRLSWKKIALLTAFSIVGLWTSSIVLTIWYALRQPLPFCTTPPPDTTGIQVDCGKVLGSSYSQIFGVPLEVFAVFYFLANVVMVYIIAFGTEHQFRITYRTLFLWRFLGLGFVAYLVPVELFALKAICVYCTIMHSMIVIDFVIISYFLFYKKAFKTATRGKDVVVLNRNQRPIVK